ncbi:MAG: hypothetical protein ABIS59_00685 [Candidatus Saccharibacteria bacterium]
MIFFDPTGKRWKNLKRASSGMIALTVLPVAGLISGAILIQPAWGNISLAHQTAQIISTLTGAQVSTPPAQAPTPTPHKVTSAAKTSAKTVSATPTGIPTTIPKPSSTPKPSVSPNSTPTPTATPSPTGNSNYGQAHKPTK